MTRRAFTKAELADAAAIANERNVAIVIEREGIKMTVAPQGGPKVDPFDLVDMSR